MCYCLLCAAAFFPGKGYFLNALAVSIGQASDVKWYANTKQLQLAYFDVCGACRRGRTLRVIVGQGMLLTLSVDDDDDCVMGESRKGPEVRRPPALHAAGVVWQMPACTLLSVLSGLTLLEDI